MALWRTRIVFDAPTLDSADRVIMGMAWETAASAAVALDDFADHFDAESGDAQPSGTTLRAVYGSGYVPSFAEVFLGTGGPALAVTDWTGRVWQTSGTGNGPSEVALVCSHVTPSPRGLSPVGRNYFGPFAAAETDSLRPTASLQNTILGFMAGLIARMAASGHTFRVLKSNGISAHPITEIRVDDAWDVQRRRGIPKTGYVNVAVP